MQPRSKRGPSWANETDEPQPVSLPSNDARQKPKRNLPAPKEPPDQPASIPEQQEGMSDLEWMRRRMTTNIETSEAKAFEQSDDEQSEDKETVRPFLLFPRRT
jgi:multiple RNA-binding domain-containing protein 1